MNWLTGVLLQQRLVVTLFVVLLAVAGVLTAPFDWDLGSLPQDQVAVDAIPDVGEAQQIVATEWPGRSPTDIEDQITYPLTTQLLGVPGVRTVRSVSMFGRSMVTVVVEDGVDFYWARARILEKMASLPPGLLPAGVAPALGPDATALGQVYWYTLEGRTPDGAVAGGWSLAELRSIQDFLVKPALQGVDGVSEVASIGGYQKEYQVEIDPDALRYYGVTLDMVAQAVRTSNRDIGARTLEVNQVEYVVRGLGTIQNLEDLERVVVRASGGTPVTVGDVAVVRFGPADRRGALDKDGAEAVGGVVVVRYGANPMQAIKSVKHEIARIAAGLPHKTLDDGTLSRVTVVPFYDRTGLIDETLETLETALVDQVLVTVLVVILMLLHFRASFLVSLLLPLSVLMTFVLMKVFGVDANVVALAGIAIAIGTMVDVGIVVVENALEHIREAPDDEPRATAIRRAVGEVGGAVITSMATTIVSFLPVFGLAGREGKLFGPLAWTKTLALLAAIFVAVVVLPALISMMFPKTGGVRRWRLPRLPRSAQIIASVAVALVCGWFLATHWMPLGPGRSDGAHFAFVLVIVGGVMGVMMLFQRAYEPLLRFFLARRLTFLLIPAMILFMGVTAWLGAGTTMSWLPDDMTAGARARMPGLAQGFLPDLDEGDFLYMPSTMPHASLGATLEAMQRIDRNIAALPEVEHAVGKLGRAESALDPAPLSMIETVILVKPEWTTAPDGTRTRNWRPEITSRRDVWNEIVRVSRLPELTEASELQPIETRIVMLDTGMRGDLGVRVQGPDPETVDAFSFALEEVLRGVDVIRAPRAERQTGKPYLEIVPDRDAIARYGLRVEDVQRTIELAVGGMPLSRTIEGREGYSVSLRYPAERRLSPEAIAEVMVAVPGRAAQIPLGHVADLRVVPGPQMIKSEDTFRTSYITFSAATIPNTSPRRLYSLDQVVPAVEEAISKAVADGELAVPAGVRWTLAGDFANKQASDQRLLLLLPLAVIIIVILLQLQFRSLMTTLMVFTGVAVAMGGGFIMLWAWGQPGFLDLELFGANLRDVFNVGPVELTVGVWVGFIALLGIATDDGVVMATYLKQRFEADPPKTRAEVLAAVVDAGKRRIRPCLMTTATTILALLPVLTSTGKGADVMVPMAIPVFGGMVFELVTLFVVPVLYASWQLARLRLGAAGSTAAPHQLTLSLEESP